MILPANGLITLDYDPTTDIISVELPDIRQFTVMEAESSLQAVIDAITVYDIKKMFLDSSKAVIDVGDEDYKKVVMRFGKGLDNTRLRKLARVGGTDDVQEQRAAKVAEEIKQTNPHPVEYQNFTSKAEAMKWLKKSDS